MHYYQFNIGDYASHTRHLSIIEDIAYRRLLDLYYLHERPLGDCSTNVARLIGMSDYSQEVETVLIEFFEHIDGGYINSRADKEIQHYHSKVEQASKAGKASAERRSSIRSTDVQPNIKHKPINTKQETKKELVANAPSVLPEWIPLETWKAFLEMRKKIKKFAQQAADIARTTVPAQHSGPDPALLKIKADLQKAVPMPDHIRQQIMSVTKRA